MTKFGRNPLTFCKHSDKKLVGPTTGEHCWWCRLERLQTTRRLRMTRFSLPMSGRPDSEVEGNRAGDEEENHLGRYAGACPSFLLTRSAACYQLLSAPCCYSPLLPQNMNHGNDSSPTRNAKNRCLAISDDTR